MAEPGFQRTLNWPEYGCEVLGTALLCFLGISAVTLDFAKGSPMAVWLPGTSARLLLTGLLFAGSGSLIAISPVGKRSGAHLNPSVTVAFWIGKKMHWHDALMYIASQFVGAGLGCAALVFMWGAAARTVDVGLTKPGAAYGLWVAFGAEYLMTATYITLIFFFVSSRRLMRKTPLMNWLVVAGLVWVEAPVSGTSLNAARSFGPALLTADWHSQWIYFVAPTLGGATAALIFPTIKKQEQHILTGKLFHSNKYPDLFKNVPENLP